MSLFTKLGNDIASPVDANGALRSVDNGDMQRWMTEAERLLLALVAGEGGDIDLPNLLIRYQITGGTADAIEATPNLPLPDAPGEALFSISIVADNTGPVTINGKPLRTNSGNEIVPGGLPANSIPLFLDLGDHFRLVSDQASAAIVAVAEGAAGIAVAAASDAEDAKLAAESAAGANLSSADSAAAAELTTIPGAVNYIRTAGYASPGDGGEALYKRATAEPSHLGKFQSADGAWWEDPFYIDFTVRIPSDYLTLQAAIDDLSRQPVRQGAKIVLLIESGHRLTAGVDVRYGDYGHFSIQSEDPVVYLDPSFPAVDIIQGDYAVMPQLACLIDAEYQGLDGYAARNCRHGWIDYDCGVLRAGNRGLYINLSTVLARNVDFSEAANRSLWVTNVGFVDGSGFKGNNSGGNRAAYFSRSSSGHLDFAEFKNFQGSEAAVYLNRCHVTCINMDVSGSASIGLFAGAGSIAPANGLVADGCNVAARCSHAALMDLRSSVISNSGAADLIVDGGGIVNVTQAVWDGAAPTLAKVIGVSEFNLASRRGIVFNEAAEDANFVFPNSNISSVSYTADTMPANLRFRRINSAASGAPAFPVAHAVVSAKADAGTAFEIAAGTGGQRLIKYRERVAGNALSEWRTFAMRDDVLTSISAAPAFIGQTAVVGGVGYMATATASPSDWKQITN